MSKRSHVLLVVGATMAATGTQAQRTPPEPQRAPAVQPVSPSVVNGSVVSRSSAISPIRLNPVRLKVGPLRLLPALTVQQSDMSGWTQLTNGAAKGGAAVVKTGKDSGTIVVRGADDLLYVAPINPAAPGGAIDAAVWRSLDFAAMSEPNCIEARVSGVTGYYKAGKVACAWLGAAGKPIYALLGDEADIIDMGGVGGDARPALAFAGGAGWSVWGGAGKSSTVKMLVRDAGKLSIRYASAEDSWPSSNPDKVTKSLSDTGWVKYGGGPASSAQCDEDLCASVQGDALSLADPWKPDFSSIAVPPPVVPGGYSTTAPAPVKLASGSYAVVVRNAQGRVYRTVKKGSTWSAWKDEGGSLKANSSLSCVANGEQPTCFVQGIDGRIYWKKLGTASGL